MSAVTTTGLLALSKETLTKLFAHADAVAPQEACGVFVRHPNGDVGAVPIKNAHMLPETHFLIDPAGLLELCIDGQMQAVVGLFHSHVGKLPHPSTSDLQLITDTKLPHLIVSVGTAPRCVWASWLHHPLTFCTLEEYPCYG